MNSLIESKIRALIREALILESAKNDFEDLVTSGLLPEDMWNQIWNEKRNKFNRPFDDNHYRSIVFNSIKKEENHTIEDFIAGFELISNAVIKPWIQGKGTPDENGVPRRDYWIADVEVPGEGVYSVQDALSSETASYDEVSAYVDAKTRVKIPKTKKMQKIIDDGIAGDDHTHFEVVYRDENWVFCYPKTYKGSITVSRMGGDLKYYGNATQPNSPIGHMPWCIAPDSSGNMFLNYHRKANLHMYIGTRLGSKYRNSDPTRKVCFSFTKQGGYVSLNPGNSTVNASNQSLDYKQVVGIVGEKIYKVLEDDAGKDVRKELDHISYYKSLNLPQFLNIMNAIDMNDEADKGRFIREAISIAEHTENMQLFSYMYQNMRDFYAEEEWGGAYRLITGIEKNKNFNSDFLNSVYNESGNIDEFHKILIDMDFANEAALDLFSPYKSDGSIEGDLTASMMSTQLKKVGSDSREARIASLLSRINIEDFSDEARSAISEALVEFFENKKSQGYGYHGVQPAYFTFLRGNESFTHSVLDAAGFNIDAFMSSYQGGYDDVLSINNVFSYIFNDEENLKRHYSARVLEKKDTLKRRRRNSNFRPSGKDNPNVVTLGAVPPIKYIIDQIDKTEGRNDNLIISLLSPYISQGDYFLRERLKDVSPNELESFKSKVIDYYNQLNDRYKASFLSFSRPNMFLDSFTFAKLFYERYRDGMPNEILRNIQMYGEEIFITLMMGTEEKNYTYVNDLLGSVDTDVFVGNRLTRSISESIVKNFGTDSDLIGKIAMKYHMSKSHDCPDFIAKACIDNILKDIDCDNSFLFGLSPQSDVIKSPEWNEAVNLVFSKGSGEKKEALLYIMSTGSLTNKDNATLTEEDKDLISNLVIGNLDLFYNEKEKASSTAASIFPHLSRGKKLEILYKADDEDIDMYIRRGAAAGLIEDMKKTINAISDACQKITEEESHSLDIENLYRSLMPMIDISKSSNDIDIERGAWDNFRHEVTSGINKAVRKHMRVEPYFDISAYAIDMNRNKNLFEFYFNFVDKLKGVNKLEDSDADLVDSPDRVNKNVTIIQIAIEEINKLI